MEREPTKPLRAAVIGVGFIGVVHARAIRVAGGELRGVGASSAEAGRAAARMLGAEHVYTNPDEVAADDAVDVVHVCTPNSLHREFAVAALNAGKHVICEKPLGIDLAQAVQLRELADEAGVVTAVPLVYRFYPMVRELRSRIADGRLGALRVIHGSYLQGWLADPTVDNWRKDPAIGGESRAFADIGTHWCDLAEFVTGDRIRSLSASLIEDSHARPGGRDRDRSGTDDGAAVQFVTAGGVTGTVVVSQISRGHQNRLLLEIDGASGSASFDQERPDVLWLSDDEDSRMLHRGSPQNSRAAQALNLLPPGHPQGFNDAFSGFVEQAYNAIRDGREAQADGLPTFADGVRAAAIVTAVLESARSRRWVPIPREQAVRSETLSVKVR